jgi:predicted Zn-dependent protease
MKRIIFYGAFLLTTIWACSKVPLSNRNQLLLVSDSEMNAMAFTSYKQFLDTSKVVPANTQQASMVKRVGDRVAKAAQSYFQSVGRPDYLEGYQWQTELIQSNQVNAWCMPGGKMVVYTGILPITQTETGLAVVMGHEVSHAIAKHGAERMSEGLLAQGLLVAGQIGLGIALKDKPSATQNLWNTVYGLAAPIGAQLGMMAHGRYQESEADHLGLIFMSMAGYNPNEAVDFWGRMAAKSGGAKSPVWLSTHPSDQQRISDIKSRMGEAMKYYNASAKSGGNGRF